MAFAGITNLMVPVVWFWRRRSVNASHQADAALLAALAILANVFAFAGHVAFVQASSQFASQHMHSSIYEVDGPTALIMHLRSFKESLEAAWIPLVASVVPILAAVNMRNRIARLTAG